MKKQIFKHIVKSSAFAGTFSVASSLMAQPCTICQGEYSGQCPCQKEITYDQFVQNEKVIQKHQQLLQKIQHELTVFQCRRAIWLTKLSKEQRTSWLDKLQKKQNMLPLFNMEKAYTGTKGILKNCINPSKLSSYLATDKNARFKQEGNEVYVAFYGEFFEKDDETNHILSCILGEGYETFRGKSESSFLEEMEQKDFMDRANDIEKGFYKGITLLHFKPSI